MTCQNFGHEKCCFADALVPLIVPLVPLVVVVVVVIAIVSPWHWPWASRRRHHRVDAGQGGGGGVVHIVVVVHTWVRAVVGGSSLSPIC